MGLKFYTEILQGVVIPAGKKMCEEGDFRKLCKRIFVEINIKHQLLKKILIWKKKKKKKKTGRNLKYFCMFFEVCYLVRWAIYRWPLKLGVKTACKQTRRGALPQLCKLSFFLFLFVCLFGFFGVSTFKYCYFKQVEAKRIVIFHLFLIELTINDNDILFYSLTTMMCFLTKEWYGFPANTVNLFIKSIS